jgi:hypothetical protein
MRISLARLAAISSLTFALFLPFVALNKQAFGDGFTMETFPPATVGNRIATLFVQVSPPLVIANSSQDTYIYFKLYDSRTNETIKFTTYHISISKGAEKDAPIIVQDFFQSETGPLMLRVNPTAGAVTIYGQNTVSSLEAWQADPGGVVKIKGPILLEGGLYHIHIEIFGIDFPQNIFIPSQAPNFDAYLSVGDVKEANLSYLGKQYNSTLISYYDKTNGFGFDPSTKTISWSMPFDWNASRIRAAPNFLVHQEVRIPKNMSGIGNTNFYAGSINGQPLPPERILVDTYTYSDVVAVHYLIDKFLVLGLAKSVGNATQMHFTLTPGAAILQNSTSGIWQAERTTVLPQWQTNQFAAGKQTTVKHQFIDRFGTGETINGNVHYDLNIRDLNGTIILTKPGLVAKNGMDNQTLTFPTNSTFVAETKITSIDKPNLPIDTRVDTARGIVVVPEFPATTIIAMVGIGAAVIIGQGWLNRKI